MERAITIFSQKELSRQEQVRADQEFFAEIFDSYYKRIYNYMRYRLGNPDESEELTSQVFEQVVRKIKTYRPERAPFEVWLFAIANHAVSDYYRKRKRREWFSLESIEDLVSQHPDPEESALQNEEHARLIAALSSLKDRERNIIAMKFTSGLKNLEIANIMGLSESNVGVILYRSLNQLRTILKTRSESFEKKIVLCKALMWIWITF